MAAVADAVIGLADGGFPQAQTAGRRQHESDAAHASPVAGYIASCEALSTLDQRDLLPKITNPDTGDRRTPLTREPRSPPPNSSAARIRREHDAARRRACLQCRAAARPPEAVVGFLTQRF